MATIATTPRVRSIKVVGLFGLYNHEVVLKEDRVTVIHGPNGVGKTVFLKLTHAFLRARYAEIARIPFRTFLITFDNKSEIRISTDATPNDPKLNLSYVDSNGAIEHGKLDGDILNVSRIATQLAESSPYIMQLGPEEWIDRRTDEILTVDDVLELANDAPLKDAKKLASREPKGLKDLRSRVKIHLIEAQRLIRIPTPSNDWRYRSPPDRPSTSTVQEYSKDLKRKLETALANYAKQSQKLDQTFPQRLLESGIATLTIEELKNELQNVEAIRSRLKRIGILDGGDPAQDPYPLQISRLDALEATQLSVMSVYAKDTKEKLAVLEELSSRIELLLGILNRKFTNKQVLISRESGLIAIGADGNRIPISALSSGEQHEIVLLYDLLFKVKQNTLVLIDEPELSLHISWQKGFMDDLLEIIRLSQFDVLMATHSPYIVGERTDLLVVLSSDRDVEQLGAESRDTPF